MPAVTLKTVRIVLSLAQGVILLIVSLRKPKRFK